MELQEQRILHQIWIMIKKILNWESWNRLLVWNAKAEKNQDVEKSHQNDYFKPRKYFLDQENIISYPRLLYITPRTLSVCKTF